jgi:hypothetical protein
MDNQILEAFNSGNSINEKLSNILNIFTEMHLTCEKNDGNEYMKERREIIINKCLDSTNECFEALNGETLEIDLVGVTNHDICFENLNKGFQLKLAKKCIKDLHYSLMDQIRISNYLMHLIDCLISMESIQIIN